MTTLLRRARAARGPGGDSERGSMPMLLLVMLVGLVFGALLIPMVITQDQTTRYDNSRTHSLHAAEAGLDTVLGLIRSSTPDGTPNGQGDPTKLPCGPLSGPSDDGSPATYSVKVAYYTADPGPHAADAAAADAATADAGRKWLSTKNMICVKGYGTYDPGTGGSVPSFALVTASGSDGPGLNGAVPGRTLQSTYVVKTTNSTTAGGIIRIFPSGNEANCLDAGTNPQPGNAVVLSSCDQNSKAQLWSYNYDLSIQLVLSVTDLKATTTARGNGLCLDSASPHANGKTVTLQWCAAQVKDANAVPRNTAAPWNQQWSSDDSAHFRGALPDKSNTDNFCMQFNGTGAALTLQACAGSVTDPAQAWVPSPKVGSGAAGVSDATDRSLLPTNHQLVNYQQFGRCLDVTNQTVSSSFLIAYSCKQNPSPSQVSWNQKWAFNSKGQWVTYQNGAGSSPYCLSSPETEGGYVTLVACPPTTTPATTWTTNLTRSTTTGAELAYRDKFTVVSKAGLCLSLAPSTDLLNGQYYKATVNGCDGSTRQKWNALPDTQKPQLQDSRELPYRQLS